jgi:ribonuclease R
MRAFGVRGSARASLLNMFSKLIEAGEVAGRIGRRTTRQQQESSPQSRESGLLPPVTVLEITGADEDGELLARPITWNKPGDPPRIYVAPDRRGQTAPGTGDRILARLNAVGSGEFEAHIIRRLESDPGSVLGVYRKTDEGAWLRSTDRSQRRDYAIDEGDAGGAQSNELVLARPLPGRRHGASRARIIERLGPMGKAGTFSRIALHEHDIPTDFDKATLDEAQRAAPVSAKALASSGRTDLRHLPLVTIDGKDARDFDDAVWAESDPDPDNPGGFHLVVAIADVAHYVRPGSALDRSAYERGNSIYFPDRVVPMLPEALSGGWCSLRPGEDRPCLIVELWINAKGRNLRQCFSRALMRSAARLTYEQMQSARDGTSDETTRPLLESVVEPLYGAYQALMTERRRRGVLEIEMPEREVELGPDDTVLAVRTRTRLDSHRLIEEFMIAANVAAAQTLAEQNAPCVYRVHESPDPEKLKALREILADKGLRLSGGPTPSPAPFTRLLEGARERPDFAVLNELILRCQARARYEVENRGHFALGLHRYCHFTSPIRRYADLLVHRSLIDRLKLSKDGKRDKGAEAETSLSEAADHISTTERRAIAAERSTLDRYLAAYLADRVGATFRGRINGVTRFGLFITLEETGADGLLPIRLLPDDFYTHDARLHALIGRRTNRRYRLGDKIEVRLGEADPVKGGLLFEPLGQNGAAPRRKREAPRRKGRKPAGRRR